MTTMNEYPESLFCWVDLVAHDLDAATGWYAELFDWKPVRQDTQGGPPYVMFQKDGHDVAGAGQMSDEMKAAGMPPMWNNYVSVADAAAVEAKARQLGATIMVPTMQVMNAGHLAFIQDPTGAGFGLWQPGNHHGAGLVNAPGSFAWNELMTRDVETAKRFYGELFGWTFEDQPMPDFIYTTIKTAAGRDNGGIVPMPAEVPAQVPANWMTYFAVDDVDAAVARVEQSRGAIQMPPRDIPGVGRFGVIADPQGAVSTLIALEQPPE